MDTLGNTTNTNYELPLSEADQAALRPALLHDLGALPFKPGALISRNLWVIFIGKWAIWTHTVGARLAVVEADRDSPSLQGVIEVYHPRYWWR